MILPDDPSVRNDPIVRRAAELLDASIVAVTPRVTIDAADASAGRSGGAADRPTQDGGADSGLADAGGFGFEAMEHEGE
jgi:hypothetical protein